MDDLLTTLTSGSAIGGGAIGGSLLIIRFIQGSFKELSVDLKEMTEKLDTVIKNYEVTKVKTEIEMDHIRSRLIELERRISKLEDNHGN